MKLLLRLSPWFVACLLVLGLCDNARAAGNAPDVKGRFVLVVTATVHRLTGDNCIHADEAYPCFELEQQPLTVIPGFDSFYLCRGAGLELQARFRSDGYTVDFACLAQGRLR